MGKTLQIICEPYLKLYRINNVLSFKLDNGWFVVTVENGRSCFFNAKLVVSIGFEDDFNVG